MKNLLYFILQIMFLIDRIYHIFIGPDRACIETWKIFPVETIILCSYRLPYIQCSQSLLFSAQSKFKLNFQMKIPSLYLYFFQALLQHGADSKICNTDGKTAYDLAEPIAKSVLSGLSLDHFFN